MVLTSRASLTSAVLGAVVAAALLAGCGGSRDKTASQTAAKVDKDEITVHQINFVLQQQRNVRPEQVEAASRQILERLIDQQLSLQKAEDLKLDRDPRVLQALEAARREIVARAYLERVAEAAPKPTPEDVRRYYEDKPALFAERRVYSLQEIAIEARPEQGALLREKLEGAKNIGEFVDFLKANDFRFAGNQAVRAAEQLPLASVDLFARMKDGQAVINPAPNGFQVVVVAGSRSQPVTEEQARPAIEQFILNERRRRLVEDDLKQLRANARIEYVGKFAAAAASSPAAAGTAPASSPAGTLTPGEISKGMGLK